MSQAMRVALWLPTSDPPDIGDNVVTINNSNAAKAIGTKFQLAGSGGSGGGISEAPSDNKPYVRLNAAWAPYDIIDGGVF